MKNIDQINPYLPGPTSFIVILKQENEKSIIDDFAEANSPIKSA